MEHIFTFLLLLCALTCTLPELEGATVSLQITPSHPPSNGVRAPLSNTPMITTTEQSSPADPSQETHTFSVVTGAEANTDALSGVHGSGLETSTEPALELMHLTTQRPSPPQAIPAELGTQEPNTQEANTTSEITVNTNQTIGLIDTVNTTAPVSSTTVNLSDSDTTDLGRANHTSMTTTEQQTREPTLPAGVSTHRLPTSAASAGPETTTASALDHTSTSVKTPQKSTTMKSTTKRTASPIKPRTTAEKEQPSETHGIVAAVLISLILLMMFVGIVFIMVKKHKWQRRRMENSEWAGPSPFLDGSSQPHFSRDSTKGGSTRISFAGFLPQNLSKSNSLLNDTDEGLAMDVVPGTTFGQNDAVETKPQNGGHAQEDKGGSDHEQGHRNTSETLPVTPAVADHNPNPEAAAVKEDNSPATVETPSVQPSTTSTDIPPPPPPSSASTDIPAPPPLTTTATDMPLPPPITTSTDMPPPSPDMDLQSSNDTAATSEVQIAPPPPLP